MAIQEKDVLTELMQYLISQGYSNEEIEAQLTEFLAPHAAPPVAGSVIGRMIAVINKLNDIKANGNLKVWSQSGQAPVDVSTMDGSTDDAMLVTKSGIAALAGVTARTDLSNVDNATFLAKATASGVGQLNKTLTIVFDDGSTEDIKVG